jgi:hypothetical protein
MRFLSLAPAIHEVVIFLTIRAVPVPTVQANERLLIRKEAFDGFYHVVARYGYMDRVDQGLEFVKSVLEEIIEYLQSDGLEEAAAASAGATAVTGDVETGGVLGSGAGHVAIEIDPTTSLSSSAGEQTHPFCLVVVSTMGPAYRWLRLSRDVDAVNSQAKRCCATSPPACMAAPPPTPSPATRAPGAVASLRSHCRWRGRPWTRMPPHGCSSRQCYGTSARLRCSSGR